MLTVDHILPVSWGGNNYSSNIQIMCEKCNRSKGMTIKHGELVNIINNIPNHFKIGKTHNFIPQMTKQHPRLCTKENFRLIIKQLPRVANYHDKVIDIMVDQMQIHLAKHG